MRRMKPQKQLLQFVMLALLSVVSVLVTSNESYAALDCTQCHGSLNSNRPVDTSYAAPASYRNVTTGAFKGSHVKHLAAQPFATDCAVCHTGAGSYGSAHRDGIIQVGGVAYVKGASFPQTATPTPLTTCTTVCHSSTSTTVGNITPVWGTQADCSSCHEVSPTTASHKQHLVDTAYTKAVCIDCHSNTVQGVSTEPNHVNNSILVTGYTGGAKLKNSAVSTCTTTYCHSSGQGATGAVATPVYSSVTWGGTVVCGSCHATTGMTTGSHTRHIAKDSNCANCHTGATATTYASVNHVNRNIDVATGVGYTLAGTAGNGYGTCSAASCHSPFVNGTPNAVATWGGTVDCDSCHSQVQTTGAHSTHFAVPAIGFTCSRCHTSSGSGVATHVNAFTNVSGTLGRLMAAPVAKHDAGNANYTATCTTVCHSPFTTAGITPNWGAQSDCNTCHTANTGAHTKHITSAAVLAAATGGLADNSCGVCHAGSTTTAFGAGHANNLVNVTGVSGGTTPKHAANAYTATCATSCHNPLSTTLTVATPNWGTPIADCITCHTSNYSATTGPSTGSHDAHRLAGSACTSCHAGAAVDTKPTAGHLDGNIDVTAYDTQNKAKGPVGATTCTTSACHNDPYSAGKVKTPVWGVADGCKACHTNSADATFTGGPATGSHAAHMNTTYGTYGASITCASCHTNPGTGASHNAGTVNVIQYAAEVTKHTAGTYLANGCAAASCHSSGGLMPAVPATWGATLNCDGCHGFPPATAYHAGITNNCNSCHSDASAGSVTTSTITNTSMHMNNVIDGGKCDSCHGYPPVQTMAGKGINASYSSAKLQNYSGGGGAHSVAGHLALTLKASNGNSFAGCLNCHPNNQHNGGNGTFLVAQVQVVVPDTLKFNGGLPITYDRTGGAGSKTTGTCSNVSCHFKATPVWSTETFTQAH